MATQSAQATTVVIPEIEIQTVSIALRGDSPLICHRWSEKAKKQMLDKQTKKAKAAKEAKDPERDFRESLYPLLDGSGFGFPTVAFKSAAVGACRFVDDIKMTQARGAMHVVGELAPIISPNPPEMREDMTRVGMGTADIRYRGQFVDWWVELEVVYNSRFFSFGQVLNLFNHAGFSSGVGEWRPERSGSYGRFHVASDAERKEMEKVKAKLAKAA